MSRVTENSHNASVSFSINKAKNKLENLQLKGANLKRMIKPSDDPMGNLELMQIKSNKIDNDQLKRNSSYALTSLEVTENSLREISEILNKAKEITIGQSSDFYNAEVRKSVAKEVEQMRQQALGIANRRLGNRYIFSGHKTLDKPFSPEGHYLGNSGVIYLEVQKDFFIPTNVSGDRVFFETNSSIPPRETSLKQQQTLSPSIEENSIGPEHFPSQSLFNILRSLENALVTDNTLLIQNLLEQIDLFSDQLITLRASIGSGINTLTNSENTLSEMELTNATRQNKIEDADIAELFSDLQKQGQLLQASYKTSSKLLNENLLDFLR
jgi:flagellar hook-associated protein 3 FlgL